MEQAAPHPSSSDTEALLGMGRERSAPPDPAELQVGRRGQHLAWPKGLLWKPQHFSCPLPTGGSSCDLAGSPSPSVPGCGLRMVWERFIHQSQDTQTWPAQTRPPRLFHPRTQAPSRLSSTPEVQPHQKSSTKLPAALPAAHPGASAAPEVHT